MARLESEVGLQRALTRSTSGTGSVDQERHRLTSCRRLLRATLELSQGRSPVWRMCLTPWRVAQTAKSRPADWNLPVPNTLRLWTRFGYFVRNEWMRPRVGLALAVSIGLLSIPGPGRAASQQSAGSPSGDMPSSAIGVDWFKDIDLGLGASNLSGNFGTGKTTNISTVLATANYRLDALRIEASLPWMRIDSPGAVFTGIGGSPIIADAAATGGRKLRQGIGDFTLGASYLLPSDLTQGVDIDLLFRVKVPTSPQSSHLSTGETDFSYGATFSKSLGRFAPLASVSYRSFGSGPNFPLKSGFSTSVGTTYAFSTREVGFLTYDYAQRASSFIAASHQVTASLTSRLPNSPLRLTSYISGGLSRGAPGVSAGLSLSISL